MPRRLDYTRGNATEWDETTLPEPVYGEREITEGEYRALAEARTVVDGFWPQFSTYGGASPADRAGAMDAAHAWLSDNATGPWSWHESWSNHGHAIDTHVYVEREPDQRAFLAVHGDTFRFVAPTPHELRKTALLRGVITPYTARESFHVWCYAHAGFIVSQDGAAPLACCISFDIPAMEDRFAQAFGGAFEAHVDGQGASYVGRRDATGNGVPLTVWLDRNSGVGEPVGQADPGRLRRPRHGALPRGRRRPGEGLGRQVQARRG